MLKKNFTAPVWALLILETIYITLMVVAIFMFTVMRAKYPSMKGGNPISSRFIIMGVLWICVLSAEAILYWKVRKRNISRRESWVHVICLSMAWVLPEMQAFMFALLGSFFYSERGIALRTTIIHVEQGLYWVLIVVAHVFFARVLIQCYSKSSAGMEGDGVNLLDDAIS